MLFRSTIGGAGVTTGAGATGAGVTTGAGATGAGVTTGAGATVEVSRFAPELFETKYFALPTGIDF